MLKRLSKCNVQITLQLWWAKRLTIKAARICSRLEYIILNTSRTEFWVNEYQIFFIFRTKMLQLRCLEMPNYRVRERKSFFQKHCKGQQHEETLEVIVVRDGSAKDFANRFLAFILLAIKSWYFHPSHPMILFYSKFSFLKEQKSFND